MTIENVTAIFDSVLNLATFAVVAVGLAFAWREIVEAQRRKAFDVIMIAEKDYDGLNAQMLADRDLREVYRHLGGARLASYDDADLKRFVFLESYYAHLARLHTLLFSRSHRAMDDDERDAYWQLYRNVLRNLLGVPVFRDVHALSKADGTFEVTFVAEVDALLAERRPAG